MTSTAVPASSSLAGRTLAQLLASSVRATGDRLRPVGAQLLMVREAFERSSMTPLPRGTRVRAIVEGDVRGLWLSARKVDERAGAILYLHGGGFVTGSARTHRHLAAKLSETSGLPVLLPEYRRAPEHPFPAAPNDCFAAYLWLLDRGYPADRIMVAGDSAGGHLVAGLLGELTRRRLPMPGAGVLFSPFLDLTCGELDARDARRRDPFVPPRYARECALAYAGEHPLHHPGLDVLRGSKRRWPPLLIQVGDTECLLGDSERLATAMRKAGAHCELQVWPGQVHAFPMFYPALPEGRAALRYAGEFLRLAGAQSAAA